MRRAIFFLLMSCGAEELASSSEALSRDGATTIVQVNPFYGGRHDGLDRSGPITYRIAAGGSRACWTSAIGAPR